MKTIELTPESARFVRSVYGVELADTGAGHAHLSADTARKTWPFLMAESGIEGVSKAFDRAGINHRIVRA